MMLIHEYSLDQISPSRSKTERKGPTRLLNENYLIDIILHPYKFDSKIDAMFCYAKYYENIDRKQKVCDTQNTMSMFALSEYFLSC